jgi:predicted metal-dependent hydrolase
MVDKDLSSRHRLAYGDVEIIFNLRRQPARAVPRIAIHVEPNGDVNIDAPPFTPLADVLAAVRKRSRWISRHVSAVQTRLAHVLPRQYVSGEAVHYLGRRYRLKVVVGADARAQVKLRAGFVVVTSPDRNPTLVRSLLDAWYRDRAREVFAARLAEVAKPLRWVPQQPTFRLQFMTRQWGSCSPGGRLTLNPWLVAASREAVDYVLLHELCHLKHPNHSRSFYATLSRHLPNWEMVKERLDEQAEMILRR